MTVVSLDLIRMAGEIIIDESDAHRLRKACEKHAPEHVDYLVDTIQKTCLAAAKESGYRRIDVRVWPCGWDWRPSQDDAYLRVVASLEASQAKIREQRTAEDLKKTKQLDLFN